MIVFAPYDLNYGWTSGHILCLPDWNYQYIARSAAGCAHAFKISADFLEFDHYTACPLRIERVS